MTKLSMFESYLPFTQKLMRIARMRRRRGERSVCTLMYYWPATICMLFLCIVNNISGLVGL